jgi:hypothetical protein
LRLAANAKIILLGWDNASGEDELLARVLITSWSLATGRTLRGVAPQALTEDELISFWADEKIAGAACQLPVS